MSQATAHRLQQHHGKQSESATPPRCSAGDFAGPYTAFLYLEDDLVVPWPVMQAWAEDAELLQVNPRV